MTSETKQNSHSISITSRENGVITGVKKVLFVKDNAIALATDMGTLSVSGHDLHINNFNETDGVFSFAGKIDGIVYSGKKEPLLKRLFK